MTAQTGSAPDPTPGTTDPAPRTTDPAPRTTDPAPRTTDPAPRTTDPDCLFCTIAAGRIPATIVHEDDATVAFRDLEPQAPTHVLVIPRHHVATVTGLAEQRPADVAAVMATVALVAEQEGIAGSGYRTVFNTGADAQQSVFHAHLHVLGGRAMTWPPG